MEDTAAVVAWLEANLGGKVVHVLRQPRWRPVWFAGVETGGETLELMVRGDRSDSDYTWSLEHEMRFQRVLSDHGIRVPRVYGWIDDPRAFVTDRCPGQADFAGTSDEDRDRVVDEYLQELARIHALPLEPFIEAGIDHAAAAGPDVTQATLGIRRMEQMYRRQKVGPDPQLEFFLGWLRRNPPPAGREAPVVWDSGQFMHHGGRLVGIIDLELGHIGDPMMDLAGWRMRDSIVPFGDFDRLYAR